MLCVGLWGSVNVAVGLTNCCGLCGKFLSSSKLLLTPSRLSIFSITPSLLFLFLVIVCIVFIESSCFSIGAVNSVASLPVLAMQRKRERDPAVPKLTWTDGGRSP